MRAPPEAFIFGRKNKLGVTSTAGPHKPRHHYKTQVPKVRNVKKSRKPSEAGIEFQARDSVGGGGEGRKTKPERQRGPLCGPEPSDALQALPVGAAVTGKPGDGLGFHPSPGIRGLPSPAPSRQVGQRRLLGLSSVA